MRLHETNPRGGSHGRPASGRRPVVLAVVVACSAPLFAVASPAAAALPPAPSSPVNFTVDVVAPDHLEVHFYDASTNEGQFRVERHRYQSGTPWTTVGPALADHRTGQPQATGWRIDMRSVPYDTSVRWCYRVYTTNAGGRSSGSNERCQGISF